MDLHPTFGRQELFETLSQGSNRSSSQQSTSKGHHSGSGGSGRGGGNNNKQQQQQHQLQSQQDEAAIRLLGHKLSLQAHEGPIPWHYQSPSCTSTTSHNELRWSPTSSCFMIYGEEPSSSPPAAAEEPLLSPPRPEQSSPHQEEPSHHPHHHQQQQQQQQPYLKVAKKKLHDHGRHHPTSPLDDRDRMSVDHHHHHPEQQQQQEEEAVEIGRSDDRWESTTTHGGTNTPLILGGAVRTPHLTNVASSLLLSSSSSQSHQLLSNRPTNRCITKRLTVQCKDCYEAIAKSAHYQQQQQQQHSSSSSLLSQQQQQRFSWNGGGGGPHHHHHQPHQPPQRRGTGRGLLASVMESTTLSCGGRSERDSTNSRTTQSISTKDTNTRYSSSNNNNTNNNNHHNNKDGGTTQPSSPLLLQLPRGACLTEPSEATANDGDDNDDGNLIVYENDLISVPRKTLRMLDNNNHHHQSNNGRINNNNNNKKSFNSSSSITTSSAGAGTTTTTTLRGSADFRILKRCGQGTFAQVFKVLHLQTNDVLALKVIKNKPAYTRQAAIEIDIYQTLRSSSSSSTTTNASTSSSSQQQQPGNNVVSPTNHMVHLHAYFMHKNHLCLVFELLGSNLYEVLKRRQFRGLSLSLVQTMMRQALYGIKELAAKNIVHCDLKPENILLASDDATKRIVQSGMVVGQPQSMHHDSNNSSKTSSTTSMVSDNTAHSVPMVWDTSRHDNNGSSQSGGGGGTNDEASGSRRRETPSSVTGGASNNGISHTSSSSATMVASNNDIKIKLIDFGSACFEELTAHTYIQSRFYRSPEVLLGLPYDSSIDMWSLGCIAAELFLGLPILPGMHEHDQMSRITEMIAPIPDWMLEQGSKATKCYVKYFPRSSPSPQPTYHGSNSPAPSLQLKWRLKTQHEYIVALSQSEVRKRGGLEKLNRPNNNRYFKREKLSEIIYLHAQHSRGIDRNLVRSFVHFLYGLLDPDPWKRLTAFQASQHPFVTGELTQILPSAARPSDVPMREMNQSNLLLDSYWRPPWDQSVCRRKLLNVQKLREKQISQRLAARSSSRTTSMMPTFEDKQMLANDRQSIVSPQSSETPAQVSSSCSNSSPYLSTGTSQPIYAVGQQQQSSTGPIKTSFQTMHPEYSVNGFSSVASSSQGVGHAIERPGVIPGNYSVSTCNSQSIGYGSAQSGSLQSAPHFLNGLHQNQMHNSWQSNAGTGFHNGGGNQSVASDLMYQQQHQFLDHVSVRSTASSISDATMITDTQYQVFLAQQQQQQQFMMAQQQQFWLAQQQQQQFGAFPGPYPPMPVQFDQQQQQMPSQVVTPGGGTYFYMVDPASGQPILLQAVGFPNQLPTGQQFVVPPPVAPGLNPRQAPAPQQQPQHAHGRVSHRHHEITSSRSSRRRTSRSGMSM